MKLKLIIWLIGLTVVLGSATYYVAKSNIKSSGEPLKGYQISDVYYLSGKTASTTPITLDPYKAASTTLVASIGNADSAYLNLIFKASTTASALNWTYYFTDDETPSTTNPGYSTNWFAEDNMTTTSNVLGTHGVGGLTHTWTPANTVASSTNKSVLISNLRGKFIKINFGGVVGTSTIYAEFRTVQSLP